MLNSLTILYIHAYIYRHTHIKLKGRGHEFGRELEDMGGERSWREGGKARNGINEEPMYEVLKKIK